MDDYLFLAIIATIAAVSWGWAVYRTDWDRLREGGHLATSVRDFTSGMIFCWLLYSWLEVLL